MDSTPSKAVPSTHRLLYRGSLSLPDSHLLLDGLSFTVNTGEINKNPDLLHNSVALSLESLRGLPLHLIGTVPVKDVWIEPPPADISIDIHPDATLTRFYFDNLFCLHPITSADRKSEYGVRVSLTDDNDPATPDLVIYAELRPSRPTASAPTTSPPSPSPAVASTSHAPPQTLHLLAARILPGAPPQPSFRLPRPDDPTPRHPPVAGAGAGAGAKRKRESGAGLPFDLSSAQDIKRAKDAKGKGRAVGGMPGMELLSGAKALGKDARVGVRRDKDGFVVPSVPVRVGRTGSEADVFGSASGSTSKGKEKEKAVEKTKEETGLERENKNTVKRAVTKALAREGVGKTHAEFKDLYGMAYHGVCFALRRRMGTGSLDAPTVQHFVDAHIKMYVNDAPE